jgi:hypothetical protein
MELSEHSDEDDLEQQHPLPGRSQSMQRSRSMAAPAAVSSRMHRSASEAPRQSGGKILPTTTVTVPTPNLSAAAGLYAASTASSTPTDSPSWALSPEASVPTESFNSSYINTEAKKLRRCHIFSHFSHISLICSLVSFICSLISLTFLTIFTGQLLLFYVFNVFLCVL